MTDLRVEPFHADHLPVPDYVTEGAVTVLDGDVVLGVVGAHQDGNAAEIWVEVSDEGRARPLTLCRVAKAVCAELLAEHGYLRARVSSVTDKRWAKHLGFVFENDIGEMRI